MAKSIQMKDINNENIYPYGLLKEFILYDNSNGSNGSITLSDIVSNYNYIEIFYRTNDYRFYSQKVYSPNGKTVGLVGYMVNPTCYIKYRDVRINEKTISTNGNAYEFYIPVDNTGKQTSVNNIFITRVVGYK